MRIISKIHWLVTVRTAARLSTQPDVCCFTAKMLDKPKPLDCQKLAASRLSAAFPTAQTPSRPKMTTSEEVQRGESARAKGPGSPVRGCWAGDRGHVICARRSVPCGPIAEQPGDLAQSRWCRSIRYKSIMKVNQR